MNLYLGYESSLELVRYLRSTGDGTIEGTSVRRGRLRSPLSSVHDLQSLDNTAEQWLSHVSRPIHAFVDKPARQTRTSKLVTHVWGPDVPNGTFVDIGHGIFISSAPALFLQLATMMDTAELAFVGMELCGEYSRWHLPLGGMGDPLYTGYEENREYTYDLDRLTTRAKIESYLVRNPGARGAVKARAALKWVLDNAKSPMETGVYLQLCLPRRLGGYGLPLPILNPKVTVGGAGGERVLSPDLFWKASGIDVEYNSDYAHSGEWNRHKDSKREVELVVSKVTVLPLTRTQVMNVDEFDTFATGLRKLMGIRARPLDAAWKERRAALRTITLPGATG